MMQNIDELTSEAFSMFEKEAEALVVQARKAGGGMPAVINTIGSVTIALRNMLAVTVANHDLHVTDQLRALKDKINLEDIQKGNVPPEVQEALDTFDPARSATKESILFAALLTVRMSPERDHQNETVPVEFSPMVVLDAMYDFEKLTGKKPDPFLNQGMVKAARRNEGIGRDVFAKFAEALKNNPGLPNTLN